MTDLQEEPTQQPAGQKVTLKAAITYPGSRVSDLLIGGEKVVLSNHALGQATVEEKQGESPDFPDPSARAPARLRDALADLVSERDYGETCEVIVDRILVTLIERAQDQCPPLVSWAFLQQVKEGRL